MRLAFLFLADTAQATSDGKFSVIGGDLVALSATSFPATNPVMALVTKIEFTPEEVGRSHSIIVDVVDEQNVLAAPSATTTVTPQNRPAALAELLPTLGLVVMFGAIAFPHAGKYTFRVKVQNASAEQDTILGSIPLYLLLQPSDSSQVSGAAEPTLPV